MCNNSSITQYYSTSTNIANTCTNYRNLWKRRKIIALEEKIAWLEEQLDAQANELNNIYDKMDKLERQFKILYSKVGDPYATRAMKDEVPPPHY